jgi:hypothetical protein
MRGRGYILELAPKGAVVVEVGVWRGDSAELIWILTRPKRLVLVDPWVVPKDPKMSFPRDRNQAQLNTIARNVRKRFAATVKKRGIMIYRETSAEAVKRFQDKTIDWVHIDGYHAYEDVLFDLKAWGQKIKHGGMLLCDDYCWGQELNFPVRRAIHQFLADSQEQFKVVAIHTDQVLLQKE